LSPLIDRDALSWQALSNERLLIGREALRWWKLSNEVPPLPSLMATSR